MHPLLFVGLNTLFCDFSRNPSSKATTWWTRQKQLALCGEPDVLSSDNEDATHVWIQTETQVVVRIDEPERVKVTQVVCEIENSSVLLGVKRRDVQEGSSSQPEYGSSSANGAW